MSRTVPAGGWPATRCTPSSWPRSGPGRAWRRTAYRRVEGAAGPDPIWVESALVLCDQAVGGLSPRSLSVLDGLLEGRTQREIAAELGISPSAVSQRVRADGLAALVAAEELMGGGRG